MFQSALLGIADAWLTAFGPMPPPRSLNMHAAYFKLGVSLIALIFDNINGFYLQHQVLLDHFLKQNNCWSLDTYCI